MTETALQRAIINALEASGYWVQRLNAGTTAVGTGKSRRVIHGCEPGTPDLLVKAPVYGFLEVKTKTGRLQPSQRAWHAEAARRGVHVAVVRGISEALETVREW